MDIKLNIGKKSNGEDVSILLNEEPNLFVTYSNQQQLYETFSSFVNVFANEPQQIKIAYAFSVKTENHVIRGVEADIFKQRFIRNEYREGFNQSKNDFWKKLLQEFRKRLKQLKRMEAGLEWQQPVLVVMIDDIFEMILSQHKKTGLAFLELAVYGSRVGIYFVVAAYGSYRNLLIQLIQLNPVIEKKLRENIHTSSLTMINPLGSELILSGEGLTFYKEKNTFQLMKLYAMNSYPSFQNDHE